MASAVSNVKAVGKVLVAALGLILAAVNDHIDLVPVQYRGYVTALIGLLTLLGIYHAPYAPLGRAGGSAGQLEGTTPPAKTALHPKPKQHKPEA